MAERFRSMMRIQGITCFVASVAALLAAGTGAAHARAPYQAAPAAYKSVATFSLSYQGSGHASTVYHANPPNPGRAPDTDDADDSSTQRWSFAFHKTVRVPSCTGFTAAACRALTGVTGATGHTGATGTISHHHVDGIYPQLNASIACTVSASTPPERTLTASVGIRYSAARQALLFTAFDPVSDALLLLPTQCPSQGDPLDGFEDNYFTPGFSFAPGYGPDRWFTSSTVAVPLSVLHRAARIDIPLGLTPRGVAPRDCAVKHPTYERCLTRGTWSGLLRLFRIAGTPG